MSAVDRGAVAAANARWKQRPVRSSAAQDHATRETLEKMALDLDAVRARLMDLALGLQVVHIWDNGANAYRPPTEEQAAAINEDPSLLPALIQAGGARVYLKAPDLEAIKQVMGYVMGKPATATEQRVVQQAQLLRDQHEILGRLIRDVLTPAQRVQVAAELERLAFPDEDA